MKKRKLFSFFYTLIITAPIFYYTVISTTHIFKKNIAKKN